MKSIAAHFCAVLCGVVLLCPVKAYAAVLIDDFADARGDDWHSYQNLGSPSLTVGAEMGWPGAPDASAMPLSGAGGTASALYAVSGVQTVEVALYSAFSTLALRRADRYELGLFSDSDRSSVLKPLISEDDRTLYLNTPDAGWRELRCTADYRYAFVEPAGAPSRAYPYGLSVYASSDGESFSQVSCSAAGLRSALLEGGDYAYYYETYRCAVPSGTRFLRLDLREVRSFSLEGGGAQGNLTPGSLRFAQARFEGDSVQKGSFSAPPDESSSSGSSSGGGSDPDVQRPGGSAEEDEPSEERTASSSKAESPSHSSLSSPPTSKSTPKSSSSSGSEPSVQEKVSAAERSASSAAPGGVIELEREPVAGTAQAKKAVVGGVYIVAALILLAFAARKK